jgi:hypothetical protein
MQLATPERFNGTWYTQYRHHAGFAKRAQLLSGLPEPILIAGCAFGYLVWELEQLNKRVRGIDASEWAVDQRVSERVHLANIFDDKLELPDMPFSSVVTEDLLPSLSDAEARLAAVNCAKLAPLVIHLVTERGEAPDLNYHSTSEWTQLTNQLTVSLEGM